MPSNAQMVLAQRASQAVAGVITLACVAHFLSPVEQGYFYTLASIAALHMALDMGLSALLVQFAAREFVGLHWNLRGEVEGAEPSRFLTLVSLSMRWYGIAAALFLVTYPAGIAFISGIQGSLSYDWRGPLALLVCATAANLLFLPVLALTEGSGGFAEVYAVRLGQGIAGATASWSVLVMGGGLYAVAMLPLGSLVVAALWMYLRRPGMIVQVFRQKMTSFHWGTEVWPLQWRIGASWLAGYVLVLMHVPLLFRTKGPVVAGQMGVTMTVASMLSIVALSWMTAELPAMVRAVTVRDWEQLDQVFLGAFRVSCWVFVAGSVLFGALRWLLEWTPLAVRFLPLVETMGLLFAMAFYHITALFTAYLRSHLREPFLWPSLIGALLTAACTILVAPRWGSAGVVSVLIFFNALFFFPIALWLWVRLRQEWHSEMV